MRRLISLAAAGLIASLAFGAPVSAAQAGSSYGAEARCRYHETQGGKFGWTEALLKRIAVTPPSVVSRNGGKQQVGWRFIVERSLERANGPWQVTYGSPIQTGSATATKPASFSAMRVRVGVPNVEYQDDVWYHITLKIFWYRPDGSVKAKASYLFSQYRMYVDGEDQGLWSLDEDCPGLAKQFFDGPYSATRAIFRGVLGKSHGD